MSRPSHVFVGSRACGCFHFAAGGETDLNLENGTDALGLIRAGGSVKWMAIAESRAYIATLGGSCEKRQPTNPPA
jgi:hypothetical protein